MSSEKMRESFQYWFKRSLAQLVRCQALAAASSFEKSKPLLELAWEESRAAIEVEFPPEWPAVSEKDEGANEMREHCVSAIESIGLKVKP